MQKDQCDLMRDKAIQLEMNLKNTKRQQLENSAYQEKLADASQLYERKIADLVQEVEEEQARSTNAEHQLNEMKNEQEIGNYQYQRELSEATYMYESKIAELQKKLEDEHARSNSAEETSVRRKIFQKDHHNLELYWQAHRVGVQKILHLIRSEDVEVQIQAVKVVANLEAEEKSHDLIMTTGGAQLLAKMVSKTDDPQTLRMVAGALDNLCGNGDKIYKFWFQ
uniref:Vacuolar protein 8 n=1 Tax=Brassica oleracea var. oleracea TaxID=109376 RepID=A0A0D3BXW8_BRAOL